MKKIGNVKINIYIMSLVAVLIDVRFFSGLLFIFGFAGAAGDMFLALGALKYPNTCYIIDKGAELDVLIPGSSEITRLRARLFACPGTSLHARGGDMFPASPVYFFGIMPPCSKAALVMVNLRIFVPGKTGFVSRPSWQPNNTMIKKNINCFTEAL